MHIYTSLRHFICAHLPFTFVNLFPPGGLIVDGGLIFSRFVFKNVKMMY
uniref:Uncharacterized protein n=1 Tax=Arundo donax TaxID=35708 RepID=A0A0A8YK26_ARUDO